MRIISVVGVLVVTVAVVTAADQSADAKRAELAALADQVVLEKAYNLSNEINEPCVVSIHTSQQRSVIYQRKIITDEIKVGDGSGFLFHSEATGSYILTNAHVVLRTDRQQEFIQDRTTGQPVWHDKIEVEVRGQGAVDATPVGADLQTDLAVIRIATGELPTVRWADSNKARIGDLVMALGYPFGVGYTATFGKISGLARETGVYQHVAGYEAFLQTDAAINPGNSGGPLVNLRGEVLGVNANIYTKTGSNVGIGFAIPANLARRVAEDLRLDGMVSRPVIGIQVWTFEDTEVDQLRLPNRKAVKVSMVMPGSPAADAGLIAGDAILAIAGEQVTGLQHFRTLVASQRLGQAVTLSVWRDNQAREVVLTPISREDLEKKLNKMADNRVVWKNYGVELVSDRKRGVRIDVVEPDSPAAQANLAVGDRIFGFYDNGRSRQVENLDELRALDGQQSIILEVYHSNRLYLIRLAR